MDWTQLLGAGAQPASVKSLGLNLLLTWILCWVLGLFYRRFGSSVSDRRAFARNFIAMGMTTMLVISVVKSSVTLSLGLVGALSIVRFRTAVKEPEELTYLFITIAIGLGMGASQPLLTSAALAVILVALGLNAQAPGPAQTGYYVVVHTRRRGLDARSAQAALDKHASQAQLKRLDEGAQSRELTFLASFSTPHRAQQAVQALRDADRGANVSLLEHRGELG